MNAIAPAYYQIHNCEHVTSSVVEFNNSYGYASYGFNLVGHE